MNAEALTAAPDVAPEERESHRTIRHLIAELSAQRGLKPEKVKAFFAIFPWNC